MFEISTHSPIPLPPLLRRSPNPEYGLVNRALELSPGGQAPTKIVMDRWNCGVLQKIAGSEVGKLIFPGIEEFLFVTELGKPNRFYGVAFIENEAIFINPNGKPPRGNPSGHEDAHILLSRYNPKLHPKLNELYLAATSKLYPQKDSVYPEYLSHRLFDEGFASFADYFTGARMSTASIEQAFNLHQRFLDEELGGYKHLVHASAGALRQVDTSLKGKGGYGMYYPVGNKLIFDTVRFGVNNAVHGAKPNIGQFVGDFMIYGPYPVPVLQDPVRVLEIMQAKETYEMRERALQKV